MRGFILLVTLAIVIAVLAIPATLGPLGFVLGLVLLVPTLFLIIYFWWAPNNLFFTKVFEGTAKIVTRSGEFDKIIFRFQGHNIDKKGNLKRLSRGAQEPKRFFGGLHFYGFWPVWDIYLYRLRWTSVQQNDEISVHDEILNEVLLKDHIYYVNIKDAEDKDMIPLDVDLLLTMKVVNPYKAIFNVQDWIEMVLGRMKPLFREYISTKTFIELTQQKQRAGNDLWDMLVGGDQNLIKEFKDKYGIEIVDHGIEMKDITPPSAYQEAATKPYLADKERERIMILADAEAEATKRKADGEKERIQKVYGSIGKQGSYGLFIRGAEAYEKGTPFASNVSIYSNDSAPKGVSQKAKENVDEEEEEG